eukprot:13974768-Alexandrium_andersonii.AAC.1
MATPRWSPVPPSSDHTAARRSRGNIAHSTPALWPRAPPSPAMRATRRAISRNAGWHARETLRSGAKGRSR